MVDYTRTLEKSAQNGFPKALSTLDSKLGQFVQVNDKTFELIDVQIIWGTTGFEILDQILRLILIHLHGKFLN